jgi:hypothetical protein
LHEEETLSHNEKEDTEMAFGDTGGSIRELIITCMTLSEGCQINAGDILALTGDKPYEITNRIDDEVDPPPIFGVALRTVAFPNSAIPVLVRGVARLRLSPSKHISPQPGDGICMADGGTGILARPPIDLRGTVLKVWEDGTVDVLL